MIKILFILFSLNLYSQEQLSVITYNMSLGNEENGTRVKEMVRELKVLDADVLCLQEVYDPDRIIKEFNFPYNYSKVFPESFFSGGVCPFWEALKPNNPFYCRLKNCSDFTGSNLILCLKEKCENSLNNLKQKNNECAQAFITQIFKHPIVDFFALMNPFNSLPRFPKKGSTGLLLLSKKQLKNKEVADFSQISSGINKGALIADIEGFRIICANTSGPLEGSLYMGSFSSREEENRVQIEKLKKWLVGRNDILLGNLNCSKAVPYTDIKENFSKNCEGLEDLGLEEPIYRKPECTYCPYNNLDEHQELGGLILDNLFISQESLIDIDVVMKNLTNSESFLSDHFGVRVIVKKNPREEE